MRAPYWIASAATIVSCLTWLASHRDGSVHPPRDPRVLPPTAVDRTVTYSNILPGDYVGPATCAECHQEQYRLWLTHPHHCMNQLPSPQSVKGDFDQAMLTLPTGEVHFSVDDAGKYWMTVLKQGQPYRRYVVTRTVGSRYMQSYIGRQVTGPEPREHDVYREHRLPFSYWFKIKRWLPREYFNILGPEQLAAGVPQCEALDLPPEVQVYGEACMNCHNTYPYAYRIFHRNLAGFPAATVAAAIEPLSRALAPTVDVAPDVTAFVGLNGRLDPDQHLVTQGISCESCHLGGREHAQQQREIRFLPTSPFTRLLPKDPHRALNNRRDNAATINGVCVQCHSGNGELLPNGAGKGNSREALDLLAGSCASQLRCVDCHEPHTGTPFPSGFTDRPEHVRLCTTCHTQYAEPDQALAHSGHAAGVALNCLDCHMPRHTRGIDELIRTHRIAMPVETSMVEHGLANACNLCHLDQSMRWTLRELDRRWGRKIDPQPDWPSYAKLDQPAGEAWLHGDDSHMRLVVTQAYARSRWGREKLPDLIRALNDPERINRVFAGFAVSRLLGQPLDQPLPVDITAAPADRARQICDWLGVIK